MNAEVDGARRGGGGVDESGERRIGIGSRRSRAGVVVAVAGGRGEGEGSGRA